MSDLNVGAFNGRLTQDAKKEIYGDNKVRVDFCVCVNSYEKKQDYPNFFNLSIFGPKAENLYPYLLKGQTIGVQYNLRQDRWEKDGQNYSKIGINVQKISLVASRKNRGENKEDNTEEEVINVDFDNTAAD